MEVQNSNKTIKGLTIESKQLNLLLDDHPYFQLGLMEKSRRYRDENHIDSIKLARKCAILFPDRALLYSYLHETKESDSTISTESAELKTEIKQEERDPIPSIEVKEESDSTQEKTYSSLEKEYLREVIDQSIQLEASQYSLEEKEETKSEKLTIQKRVLSFSEWIGGDEEQPISTQSDIIDQFIQEAPQIGKASSTTFYSPSEKGKESISEDSLLYSETLASIFVQQGNIELAIKAYRYLMLKNPQKSIYFADLIKKLEENN